MHARVCTQGEDVVAGIRTPEPIERLSETLPEAYAQLIENCRILEAHYKDMQVCVCVLACRSAGAYSVLGKFAR
jgi:hypothetical protein